MQGQVVKKSLYALTGDALPDQPLWSAQIDWTHQQDVAELKVKTAQGVVLEDQLPSASRIDLADAPHPLGGRLRCWSNRRKLMLSVIEVVHGRSIDPVRW